MNNNNTNAMRYDICYYNSYSIMDYTLKFFNNAYEFKPLKMNSFIIVINKY